MHFTWEISFGQIVVSIPILWVVYVLFKVQQMMLRFRMEHEILMTDWAERNDKKLHDLPTRQSKWW